MKVLILVALVAVVAPSRPLQYSEPAIGPKEPMKPVGIVHGKTYVVHTTMEENSAHGINTPTSKEGANEQERNEMDVREEMEAAEKEPYQVAQPAAHVQPKGPMQIYDPAPAAFQVMSANAPSSNEAKINAINLKRQNAVNRIAKIHYANPPKEAHNSANHNRVFNGAQHHGYNHMYNQASQHGLHNLGYYGGYHYGYNGGYYGPQQYAQGYNHGYNGVHHGPSLHHY